MSLYDDYLFPDVEVNIYVGGMLFHVKREIDFETYFDDLTTAWQATATARAQEISAKMNEIVKRHVRLFSGFRDPERIINWVRFEGGISQDVPGKLNAGVSINRYSRQGGMPLAHFLLGSPNVGQNQNKPPVVSFFKGKRTVLKNTFILHSRFKSGMSEAEIFRFYRRTDDGRVHKMSYVSIDGHLVDIAADSQLKRIMTPEFILMREYTVLILDGTKLLLRDLFSMF